MNIRIGQRMCSRKISYWGEKFFYGFHRESLFLEIEVYLVFPNRHFHFHILSNCSVSYIAIFDNKAI